MTSYKRESNMIRRIALTVIIAAGFLSLTAHAQLKLNGAGATFPYVIYSKWFDEYNKKTGVQINYQSIGSGGGVKQTIEGTVDFGASDAFLTKKEMKAVKKKQGTDILHIPTVLGAVVVTYNVKGVGKGLKLTPKVLAGIFLGKITKWNDKRIVAINKGKKLPNKSILVARRSDGSGTTSIFTDYLSKISPEWKKKVGTGKSVKWPVGLGGKGNDGVAGLVKQTDGAIGYVELAYSVQNGLPYASIKNRSGAYVAPNFKSVSAAGALKKIPADLRVSITNSDSKDAYPIAGFTWLLVYKDMKNKRKKNALVKFLKWALTDGEKYAQALHYAPLPPKVAKMCLKKVDQIRYKK
jgi:phosphate transport system substrate-binding protein